MQALAACRARGWNLADWYALPRAEQTLILAYEMEMAQRATR